MLKHIPTLLCLMAATTTSPAANYYVSPDGKDSASGLKGSPWKSLSKAAAKLEAGDTCLIAPGRYRETLNLKTSGTEKKPIRFVAQEGGKVVIDGTDPVQSAWTKHEGNIWKTPLDRPQVEQLFVQGVMQHEARWPDAPFATRWDRQSWGKVGKTTEYGKLEAPGLKKSGVDWTGGILMINAAHQFFTWTRTITSHEKGSDFITYDRDLPGLAFADPKTGLKKDTPWMRGLWKDDYFYLFGKLGALTVPTEWFHDPEKKLLYYMPKGNEAPKQVAIKTRDYGINAKNLQHIHLEGIHIVGCAFNFTNCKHITLTDCHVRYPNFKRRLVASEQEKYKAPYPSARMSGANNRIERCSIQMAGGTALAVSGNNNVVENSIIRDGCWSGDLLYSLAKLNGKNNILRRCTIAQGGAPLLHHHGPNIIEYNHFYDAGSLSEDIAAVYTAGGKDGNACRGATVRFNWVHDVNTDHGLGIGIRGDDMTRGLIIHHNVVWDCGKIGIIAKGGENQIFNNTILDVYDGDTMKNPWKRGGLTIPTQPEPRKPWKPYHKMNIYLNVQNTNSVIANNLVDTIFWRMEKITASGIQANYEAKENINNYLVNPEKKDFRLKPNAIATLPKPFEVKTDEGKAHPAKYIGALDPGQPAWKAGADWTLK
jgi:hypothetical protein